MIRRINLYAGPGTGKSTTAAWLFSMLKRRSFSVELVQEIVKGWAIERKPIKPFDQAVLFGKQLNSEYHNLAHGIDLVVTDSPILLSSVYSDMNNPELGFGASFKQIAVEFEKQFPAINVILRRNVDKHPYNTQGRYQTLEQAGHLDRIIETAVRDTCPMHSIVTVEVEQDQLLLDIILGRLVGSAIKDCTNEPYTPRC